MDASVAAASKGDEEGWSAARAIAKAGEVPAGSTTADGPATPLENAAPVLASLNTPSVAAPLPIDLAAVASLCTELSRVDDTMALPPLLERAATLLDAAGIILWIADPDGRELNRCPGARATRSTSSTGSAQSRAAAENATAAAFRTGLLQTVYGDGRSTGAIAAPLVTCGGCVGVMAAEVRGDTEKLEANLAAATILAAQLASLVGPPSVRRRLERSKPPTPDAPTEPSGGALADALRPCPSASSASCPARSPIDISAPSPFVPSAA